MKILAFDPGKENFAWAVLNSKGRCRDHGFVRTATDLSIDHIVDEVERFSIDIEKLIATHTPDFICIERMQHRPKFGGGGVVEYINIMIGLVLAAARKYHIRPMIFVSGTWKAHMAKLTGAKKGQFTMTTQKLTVKAPRGMKRKFLGKMIPVKKTKKLFAGALDGQPGHAELSPHEGDAIGIGCYGWYKVTGVNIVGAVLT